MPKVIALLLLAGILSGCASIPSPPERRAYADALAAAKGWRAEVISAGQFQLLTYAPQPIREHPELTVYIEGDGFAWVTGSTPSADPTPREPLALKLALKQAAGNAVYLGRPCQYVDAEQTGCAQRYWTNARFAPEVVLASSKAVDALKARFGATRLTLVGYSGGGAIAALVAARRNDVERLVTIAGNLDHRAWTQFHHVDALAGSLNPADEAGKLRHIRQWHFVGSKDRITPPALLKAYVGLSPPSALSQTRILPDFDHQCCWEKEWPILWQSTIR